MSARQEYPKQGSGYNQSQGGDMQRPGAGGYRNAKSTVRGGGGYNSKFYQGERPL